MKAKYFGALVLAVATAGCAAPVANDEALQGSADALTLAECATQQDTCFRNNPFFGFFTCPVQYAQCTATASNGLPAQVVSAVRDAAACAQEEAACLRAATTPAANLACVREEAECVAAIVDARLPQIVTGTRECVESAASCIQASETANDLAGCADDLQDCAVDQVVEVLPPEVGTAVDNVRDCLNALDVCAEKATSPAQLTACTQTEIRCVADGLGVTLPDVPVAEAVQCAETAATCTFNATSVMGVRECGANLVACNARLTNPNAQLTCEQKWTQCLVRNPFAFFQCAADLNRCRSN